MTERLARDSRGFSLIELLVTILIVGTLAAIALPVFLRQSGAAQDAQAKAHARMLVTQVMACFAESDDFRQCDGPDELMVRGLRIGGGPGQVRVSASSARTFTVRAVSLDQTGGIHRWFSVAGGVGRRATRDCGPRGYGGCRGADAADEGNYW